MNPPDPTGAPVDTAEEMERIRWDYDPEDDLASPLVRTERYFQDFPWDADDDG